MVHDPHADPEGNKLDLDSHWSSSRDLAKAGKFPLHSDLDHLSTVENKRYRHKLHMLGISDPYCTSI